MALRAISESDSRVRIVTLRRNFGQTPALKAGFDAARGDIIISMDGDLQHDPEEIPAFIAKLEEGYDIVSGWRAQRRDGWLTRRLPSRIANWMMAKLSGVALHDFGTTFKAYRRETIQEPSALRRTASFHSRSRRLVRSTDHGDPHQQSAAAEREIQLRTVANPACVSRPAQHQISARFLDPAAAFLRPHWAAGHRIRLPDWLRPDLSASWFVTRRSCCSTGRCCLPPPCWYLGGIQILCLGLVAEILSRTYYESQGKPIYAVRETRNFDPQSTISMYPKLRRIDQDVPVETGDRVTRAS